MCGRCGDAVIAQWGVPASIVCDRFELAKLQDVINFACPIEVRLPRWSESTSDINDLRKIAKDGPLSISQESRSLIAASLAVAIVKNDDAGNYRMVKSSNNTSRDDICARCCWQLGHTNALFNRPTPTATHVVV